jgi:hypothetical protein
MKRLATSSLDILLKYPAWRNKVFIACSQAQLPPSCQPSVIEFFDQQGLLVSQAGGNVFSTEVPVGHRSEFMALYFDGDLVLFIAGEEIILNRLGRVCIFAAFDLES